MLDVAVAISSQSHLRQTVETLFSFVFLALFLSSAHRHTHSTTVFPFKAFVLLPPILNHFLLFPSVAAMIVKEAPKISAMLASLIIGKAAIITTLSLAFGISFANSQLSGLLLAQGGAFSIQ